MREAIIVLSVWS